MSKIVSSRLDEQQALAFVRELLDSDLSVPYDSGYFELVNTIGSIGFTGAGFSGFSADLPSTGFITEIEYYSSLREFTLTGGLISVSSLKAAVLAGDTATVGSLLFGTNDTLSGFSPGSLLLHGFGGHDTITGSTANDQLFGDDGSDVLKGDLGDDVLDGGSGDDTASFALPSWIGQTAGVKVDLRIQTPQNTGHGNDLLRGIENVWGTPNADTLSGDNGPNILDGSGGKDELYGYGGDDVLYSNGTGVADGGAGYDTLSFLRWDTYGNLDRPLTVDLGQSGVEQEVANTGYPFYSRFLLTVTNIERVDGSPYADIFKAAPVGTYLFGGGGSDSLSGLAGNDTLQGGTGDDSITDTSGSNYLRGDDGNDAIYGGSAFDDINGNKGNDTINGGAGGNDWLVGGQGGDLIIAGHAASNILYGNIGDDTLNGGSGGEILRGGQENDVISAGDGDDWLSGDRGNDTMTGGAGADIFHTFNGAGLDRVLDFSAAAGDRVQLDPGTTYTVSQVGADTVIDLGAGEKMILVGVQSTSLPPGWIF